MYARTCNYAWLSAIIRYEDTVLGVTFLCVTKDSESTELLSINNQFCLIVVPSTITENMGAFALRTDNALNLNFPIDHNLCEVDKILGLCLKQYF